LAFSFQLAKGTIKLILEIPLVSSQLLDQFVMYRGV